MQLSVNMVHKPRAFDDGIEKRDEWFKNRSPESAEMVEYFDQTDAILGGIKSLRAEGKKYLPTFPDEKPADYKFRLSQTKFTNIFHDICETLASKPFEENVTLKKDEMNDPPAVLDEFTWDVDGKGNNLTVFAASTFFNGIAYAIDWILIDYPEKDDTIRTQQEQRAANLRPFFQRIAARNVLAADYATVGGRKVLSYVKIWEPGKPNNIREFIREETTGQISFRVWEEQDSKEWVLDKEGPITIDVIPMVPFATGRMIGESILYRPPLSDASDLQIEHYQQESALKFVKTLSAYPMLAGNGVNPPRDNAGGVEKIRVKPMQVLYAPPDGEGRSGTWQFIEPSSQSLTFLSKDAADTAQSLRELGKQPLTVQGGNITVITSAIAAGKSRSAVGAWSVALKDALENAMVIAGKYFNISPDQYSPEISIYTDFDNVTDDDDVSELGSARARGDISQETYWSELQRRRILSSDFKADDERARILREGPPPLNENGDPNDLY